MSAVDGFRDEILSLAENTVNERYRARLIKQEDLWRDGVELGKMMSQSQEDVTENTDDEEPGIAELPAQVGKYFGGKWGVHLRAPDLWFRLLDNYGNNFSPLGQLAKIRLGVKSGKDSFFFPIDCSPECLVSFKDPDEFQRNYGVSRKVVESGAVKLVRCGEGRGEIKPIESCYLEPEVHSLMEIDGFTVSPENCSRLMLLVNSQKVDLKNTFALKYIQWGESQRVQKGSTCASRVTADREWYDLTGMIKGQCFGQNPNSINTQFH